MSTEEKLLQNEAAQRMLQGTRRVDSFPYGDDECVLFLKPLPTGDRLYYGWTNSGKVTLLDIELPQIPDMFESSVADPNTISFDSPIKKMRIEAGKKLIQKELNNNG